MQKTEYYLTCADGHSMPVYHWQNPGTALLTVVIAHGMAEYAERYAPVAERLVEQGFEVVAFDQRGHGKAVYSKDKLGLVEPGWYEQQVADIDVLVMHLRSKNPGRKICLLAHSMGSFLAQRYFQRFGNHLQGLVLSATNGKNDPLLGAGIALAWLQMRLFGRNHRSVIIDKLSFGRFNAAFKPNRTDHDWLSRDETEVDKYVNDPMCGFTCSACFFYYFFRGIKAGLKPGNIERIPKDIPVYAFAGEKDPVGLEGKGFLALIHKWKSAGVTNITYDLYNNGRHEMLNDINRDEVIQNLVNWLKKLSDLK